MQIAQKQLQRFELVNIVVPAGSTLTKFYFPDEPQLRGRKIWQISAYNKDQMAYSPDNVELATSDDIRNAFLVLVDITGREIIRAPLVVFCNIIYDRSGVNGPIINQNANMPLDDITIVWEKSYISLSQASVTGTQFTYQLGVFYR